MNTEKQSKFKKYVVPISLLAVGIVAVVTAFYFAFEEPTTAINASTTEQVQRTPVEALDDKLTHTLTEIDSLLDDKSTMESPMFKKYRTRLENLREKAQQEKTQLAEKAKDVKSEAVSEMKLRVNMIENEVEGIQTELTKTLVAQQDKVDKKIENLVAEVDNRADKLEQKTSSKAKNLKMELKEARAELEEERAEIENSTEKTLKEIKADVNAIEKELNETLAEIDQRLEKDNV